MSNNLINIESNKDIISYLEIDYDKQRNYNINKKKFLTFLSKS